MQGERGNVEQSVLSRYAKAAGEREAELCCPVSYDARYLELIPQEILDRDYGCGDPSRRVKRGDTVLDLGSGGGKICFIASRVVGPEGRVMGIDMNDEMLALAISGAIREDLFFEAFERAGFQGIRLLERGDEPWHTVQGIDFRSVTVEAFKGRPPSGCC